MNNKGPLVIKGGRASTKEGMGFRVDILLQLTFLKVFLMFIGTSKNDLVDVNITIFKFVHLKCSQVARQKHLG